MQLEESILAAGPRSIEKLSIHVSLALERGCLSILVLQISARGVHFTEKFKVLLSLLKNEVLGFLKPISAVVA